MSDITPKDIARKAGSTRRATLSKAAQEFLTSAELMQKAGNQRWTLAERLFPYFTLPTGWLEVALQGELKEEGVAELMMTRLERIITSEDALRESDFIRVFIIEEPATYRTAYRRILHGSHLDEILRVAKLLPESEALNVIRRIHLETIARNRRR